MKDPEKSKLVNLCLNLSNIDSREVTSRCHLLKWRIFSSPTLEPMKLIVMKLISSPHMWSDLFSSIIILNLTCEPRRKFQSSTCPPDFFAQSDFKDVIIMQLWSLWPTLTKALLGDEWCPLSWLKIVWTSMSCFLNPQPKFHSKQYVIYMPNYLCVASADFLAPTEPPPPSCYLWLMVERKKARSSRRGFTKLNMKLWASATIFNAPFFHDIYKEKYPSVALRVYG